MAKAFGEFFTFCVFVFTVKDSAEDSTQSFHFATPASKDCFIRKKYICVCMNSHIGSCKTCIHVYTHAH